MTQKILIVDDEPKILRVIEHCLCREGFAVTAAVDGQQAINEFHRQEYDLVILDLSLPFVDGFQVCRTIRPVELTLRVKAILRRTREDPNPGNSEGVAYNQHGLAINPASREVMLDNQRVELTAKEFALLWFLIKHPNKVFTRKQLLYQIWQSDYMGNEDTVTVLISRLREKTKRNNAPSLIQTLRGVGYKFTLD